MSSESSTRIGVEDAGCLTAASAGRFKYGVSWILLDSGTVFSVYAPADLSVLRLALFHLAHELVARTMHREDEARLLRLGFHFLPQADNMRIHRPRCREAIVAPYFLKQTIAA